MLNLSVRICELSNGSFTDFVHSEFLSTWWLKTPFCILRLQRNSMTLTASALPNEWAITSRLHEIVMANI
jgi:hypothetical protein